MADVIDNKIKQPSQQQKGTGFTNIQNIVRANRQNRLGQAVSGGVSDVIGRNQQDLSKAREQFQQDAQQNAIGTAGDQAYAQQTIQNAGQTGANPAQADVDRFAKLRAGMYQGPTQLGNQEQLMAQGADLKGLGNAAANEYGRRGLLQRFVGPDQYTQGQQRLDNLLLGQTGGQALNQARRNANLFGQQLGQAQQSAQAQGQGLTQQAQQFGQNLTGQLGQAQTGLESDLANRATQQTKESEATREALKALFTRPQDLPAPPPGTMTTMPIGGGKIKPTITQEQYDLAKSALDRSGLGSQTSYSPEYFANSPEELIGQGITQATKQTVASDADKSRALALAKLAGGTSSLFGEDTQVGGYDPLSFLNRDTYDKRVAESKKGYDEYDALQAAEQQAKAAQDVINQGRGLLHQGFSNSYSPVPTGLGTPTPTDIRQIAGSGTYRSGEFLPSGEYAYDPSYIKDTYSRGGPQYMFSKSLADQLQGNYSKFNKALGDTNQSLKGQGFNELSKPIDFGTYLNQLGGGIGPNMFDQGSNILGNQLGTTINQFDTQEAERQAKGAGSPRLALLERLQGLINSNGGS